MKRKKEYVHSKQLLKSGTSIGGALIKEGERKGNNDNQIKPLELGFII